ncbi:MAG: glycosyltransferase family 4 protein [Bacteroidales bacterium]|nr:glycosyltransferase family 4 protein [Bacteroidales bacterium]
MLKKLIRLTTVSLSQNLLLKGQLKYLSNYYEVVAVASGAEELRLVGEREGVRCQPIEMCREISIFSDIRSLFKLYFLFKKEKPYIVHANTPKGSLLGMIAAKFAGVPNRIYTVTGLRFETEKGLKRAVLKFTERLTCKFATKVIPEGDGVKDIMIKENICSDISPKIHNGNINGVDLNYYDANNNAIKEKALSLRKYDFTFCFVGRITKHKGINELVRAFVRLNKDNPHTGLILVGPIEEKLDSEIQNIIELHPHIRFEGYQVDIRPYLSASDIFVFPSYREGFPNVVLQAGAMSLPSIVTDISGSREIIQNNVNGVIIPPKDEDALYDAMKRMMNSKDELKAMGERAREVIEKNFDQKDVWEGIKSVYDSL